jgi:hypothetical protein
MLIEEPPYFLIDGVSVVRDHADPLQFYYQPLAPRLVTRDDGGVAVPQLSLLEFRSEALSGGMLSFDVHLGLTDDELENVRRGLVDLANPPGKPRLAPVPVVDGAVSLLLFGKQSGGPAGANPEQLVLKVAHSARPSLFNDNRAAFSVRLDEQGVTLLRAAMNLELSPIGVVYRLDYLALRPAYHVKLEIDWDRTQDIMDESFGHEGLFTNIQIQEAMERLEEERAIVFNTDTFVPEDDTSSVLERRNAAVARARDMITDAFFESSIDPRHEPPDGWDKARDIVKSFAPQRFAPLGVFSYRKEHVTRIDRKRLDVDLSERTTILRSIYPQGHLAGLFRLLGQGFDPARLITKVNADDPWFKRRRVTTISRAGFGVDPVVSMTATMHYGGEARQITVDHTRERASAEWFSVVDGGQMVLPVQLSFAVDLEPAEAGERPNRLESAPREVLGEEYELQPRELFSLENIPILTLAGFPFNRYPRVDVQLRYEDAEHAIRQDDVVRITQAKPEAQWTRFLVGPPAGPIQLKLTYHAADGRDHETAFMPATKPQVDVPDPFPRRLVVKIVEALGPDVERAFVDLVFDDRENDQLVEGSVEVVPDQPVEPFVVDRIDPTFSMLRYRITLLMKDTSLFELPPSTTLSNRIFVRADLRGHRAVLVRPPATFVQAGLERVRVEARAADEAAGLSFADQFDFTGPRGSALFEFDFVDPVRDAYELRMHWLFRSGMSVQGDWTRFDTDIVTIPTGT